MTAPSFTLARREMVFAPIVTRLSGRRIVEQRPMRFIPFPEVTAAVTTASEPEPPVSIAPQADGRGGGARTWCTQCDRRVFDSEARGCQARICPARNLVAPYHAGSVAA